jgi:ABC-type sugar transport system permease subunit
MTAPAKRAWFTPSLFSPTRHRELRALWRRGDLTTAALFLAPSLVAFAAFIYFPLAYNVYISLTSWNLISPIKKFVGLQNYQRLIQDERFWLVLKNTAYYSLGTVFISLLIALGLALLLNRKLRGRSFYRAAIFSPYVTTPAVIALLWLWIFDPQFGLLNSLLKAIGIRGPEWLASTQWALPAIMIMMIWRTIGYDTVIFLAGLQSIPDEYYEAATIDGASNWHLFRYITLPLLSPTTFFIIVTATISSFQVFDAVAVMTGGGPLDSTNVLVYFLYEHAFRFFEAGRASAIAVVLFTIVAGLTALQLVLSRRWVHY